MKLPATKDPRFDPRKCSLFPTEYTLTNTFMDFIDAFTDDFPILIFGK